MTNPTARIACGKSVIKHYANNTVYLEKDQEFQFELFNPTTKNIAAEILLNDEKAFQSLLILRPGERLFLDCNPETKRRFKFETYTVSGENKEVKEAIKNNGKVEVRFYNEQIPIKPVTTQPYVNPCYPSYPYQPWGGWPGSHITYGGTGNPNPNFTINTSTTNFVDNSQNFIRNDVTLDEFGFNASNIGATCDFTSSVEEKSGKIDMSFKRKRFSKEIETGHVEQGSVSDQGFTEVDKEFSPFPFCTVSLQLLPISQKETITSSEVRLYCTACGLRNRHEWKFCPKCGHKF